MRCLPAVAGCVAFFSVCLMPALAAPGAAEPASPDAAGATRVAQSPQEEFCQAVARQDMDAGEFDAPTKAAIYARSLAQCLSMHPR